MTRRSPTTDRRTAIQALAAGLTAGSTGCFESIVGESNPDCKSMVTSTETMRSTPTETTPTLSETSTEVATPATPDYLEWVFATGLMDYSWPITTYSISPAIFKKYQDRLNSDATSTINGTIQFPLVVTQVVHQRVSEVIKTRNVYVLLGDFKQRTVDRNRLNKFERQPPEYRGFLLYESREEEEALAAKDGVVVATEQSGKSTDPMKVCKHVIDTGFGDAERLVEERPIVKPLASWVSDRTINRFVTHPPYTEKEPIGMIGYGESWMFNDDAADARYVLQFDDVSQATDDAIDSWLNKVKLTQDWTDTTRNYYGEIVIIDGIVTYDEMLWES